MSTEPTGDLDAVATTSRITAAMRAVESARPDRLFDDPYARTLAGDVGYALAGQIDTDAGDEIPIRTRFGDDALRAAVDARVRQVVLVAAGMDTRAWRLDLPEAVSVFELDRPSLLALKGDLLDGVAPTARRVPVPVDLAGDWPVALRGAGFDPAAPTCWIMEGLLQYLPEESVLRLLDAITGEAAPGSHLLADLVGAGLLASPRARPLLEAMAAGGSPWIFGTDDPEALLSARGWTCDVRYFHEYAAGLGRARTPGSIGDGTGGEYGYLVHAVR